ncbi:Beta-barrel assembly-enhancing protease [Duffyella gerundensis]|uniref:Beta-barrel assembly-enhancing protease n=1 Tax=Duffyella gerundensis TaxID=1619313 RepID=A0A0U5L6U9_9GAMM|nr:M48 family metallopeptidase [Duffyella gerundensis]UCB30281.1 Beta-barrel assembly-enhancing protease [Duffyella gerundensis]CUU24880.1 TPR repeat-containing protein YfgC [Duffyella gerundensis]
MMIDLKKTVLATLLCCQFAAAMPARADMPDNLPDIGTTAGATLSINQELQMGDFYVRQLRASAPLINDPLLNDYINQLGQRLVSHAQSVRTPFHFFLIRNDELNAFAFFGGNVVLHSALFRYADNESQLASVMAHEISHVTQRHLARAMEEQQRNAPLTWVGVLGSILLAMANPQGGMAALTGTLAGTQQGVISFTQNNEQEADRIGIQVLQRAGFDPQAMPNFLQKLADQSRFSSRPPEILLTHPLPDSRLSDARNRANQMKPMVVQSSQDFYMAKVRALGMYATGQNQLGDDLLNEWMKGNSREQAAAQYGKAVQFLQAKSFDNAKRIIAPLLAKQPANVWYLDIMSDIEIGLNQPQQAVALLSSVKSNSPVVQLNLANALLEAKQPANASRILNRYTWAHPDDSNGWDLLAQASAAQNLRDEELSARAEGLALGGQLDQAITTLSSASAQVPLGSLKQARYDARIDQLRQLQQRFRRYQKG